jgi:hypothetical protein
MKLDAKQCRFCRAIACEQLDGRDCKSKECIHPNQAVAIEERLEQLKAVQYGR